MTAHELAHVLLDGPDLPVAFWEYMGGDEELREVESALPDHDRTLIVLRTFKPEAA